MLTEERHSIITDTVNTRKSVTIAELCRILDVSASTVKRDLNILAEAGKITKVRGGAISLDESFSAVEKNVEEKSAICTEEKTAIAAYAASLVENGDFIFLDAGHHLRHQRIYSREEARAERIPGVHHRRRDQGGNGSDNRR